MLYIINKDKSKLNKEFTMRVMHAYCLNYNYGDYALGYGVKNIFRKLFNIDYFGECNLQGQVFDDYFIDLINKNYDLLVIGGGGIIHGAHWPQGWFWLIEQENIKKIKIPFIIYGAGYNYFKDETGIPERGIEHLKEVQQKAALFSVRNDGSHARLNEQTGIDAVELADTGFWYSLDFTDNYTSAYADQPYIIVQLANDKPEHRFGTPENRDTFIKNMIEVLSEYNSQYHILFIPHVFADASLSKDISKEISNSSVLDFGKYAFDRTYIAMNLYKDAEFVLAMRGHGQIIPLSFNTPVISLENHHKHRELMEHYGLGEYNVDITDASFSRNLIEKVESLISNKEDIVNHSINHNKLLYEDTVTKLTSIPELKRFVR